MYTFEGKPLTSWHVSIQRRINTIPWKHKAGRMKYHATIRAGTVDAASPNFSLTLTKS